MEDIARRIARIRDDREHSSRWLVQETILLLRDIAQLPDMSSDTHMQLLYHYGQELAQVRPAMAAVSNAVGRVLNVRSGPAAVVHMATNLLQEYTTATERIALYAQPYLHGHLLTCSLSGTVLDVLVNLRAAIEQVTVLEGRPRYEGREMARALSAQHIPVTLITDAQADIFLPQCQGVVVGADSILADGDILNKAGTALLAWAASGHHIPFYVVCETLKISSRQGFEEAWLEEKEPEEVLPQAIPGIRVRNVYFDRTPNALMSKMITERGVLQHQQIREIAADAQANACFLAKQIP